jgi:hypothetical protein
MPTYLNSVHNMYQFRRKENETDLHVVRATKNPKAKGLRKGLTIVTYP